jgi:hypothetical protein
MIADRGDGAAGAGPSPPFAPAITPARAIASGLCGGAAIGGFAVFSAANGWPAVADAPASALIAAAISLGAAAACSLPMVAALRRAHRSWGAAVVADALTYAPLLLLWLDVIWPGRIIPAVTLFWAAVAATGAAKLALAAGPARAAAAGVPRLVDPTPVVAVALALSAAGRIIAPFALIGVAARIQMIHLHDAFPTPEAGFLAHAGQLIVSGGVLYRDVHSVFPPVGPYLHAGIFAVLGSRLVLGNIIQSAGPILLPLALYYVGQQFMPAGIAFIAAVLAALVGDGGLAGFFALCAIGVGLAASGDRRANWIMSGVFAGISVATDLQVGVSIIVALALMLLLRQRVVIMRRIGAAGVDLSLGGWALAPLGIGLALVWGPMAVYAASRGALAPMWSDLAAGARGEIFRTLRPWPADAAVLIPAGIYALALLRLLADLVARRLEEAHFVAFSVIAMGAVGWAWSLATRDAYHLAMSAPTAYLVGAALLGWAIKAAGQSLVGLPGADQARALRAGAVTLALIGMVGVWNGWARIGAASAEQVRSLRIRVGAPAGWQPLAATPGEGAYTPAPRARAVDKLVAYVQRSTLPNEPIFCVPQSPALYVLVERPNATRLDCAFASEVSSDEAAEAVVALESRKTRIVIVSPSGQALQAPIQIEPIIARYLARRYRTVGRIGQYVVLLRRGASLTPSALPAEPVPPPVREAVPPGDMFAPRRD